MIDQLKAFFIELESEDILQSLAITMRQFRDELVHQGFSTREAMEIVKAWSHGMAGGKL